MTLLGAGNNNRGRNIIVILGLLVTLGILLLFLGHANDDAKEEESIKFKKGKVTKEESMVRKSPGRIGAIKMAKQPRDLCQVPSHQYGQDRRRDTKAPLKIVSFNVEWLFLKGGKGAIKCPSSSCPWRDDAEAEMHLRRVASTLAQLDADLIHVIEVEDCDTLERLIQAMLDPSYRGYMIPSTDTATGQNVGLITRIDPVMPLIRTNSILPFPLVGSKCPRTRVGGRTSISKHYLTRFHLSDGRHFFFLGCHLLARPLDRARCASREAQAQLLIDLVLQQQQQQQQPSLDVILAGDLNDYDADVLGQDGVAPISNCVGLFKTQLDLINAAALLSPSERYSDWHDVNGNCRDDGPTEHALIDHLLLSRRLAGTFNFSISHQFVSCSDRVSDHFPLVLTLLPPTPS